MQLSVGAMIAIYIFELFGWQPQVQAARVQPLANELLGMLLTAGDIMIVRSMGGVSQYIAKSRLKSRGKLTTSMMLSATQLGLSAFRAIRELNGPLVGLHVAARRGRGGGGGAAVVDEVNDAV